MSYTTYKFCHNPIIHFLNFSIPVFACLKFGFGMGYFSSIAIPVVSGFILLILPVFQGLISGLIIPAAIILSAIKLFLTGHVALGCVCVAIFIFYEVLRISVAKFTSSDPGTAAYYAERYVNKF